MRRSRHVARDGVAYWAVVLLAAVVFGVGAVVRDVRAVVTYGVRMLPRVLAAAARRGRVAAGRAPSRVRHGLRFTGEALADGVAGTAEAVTLTSEVVVDGWRALARALALVGAQLRAGLVFLGARLPGALVQGLLGVGAAENVARRAGRELRFVGRWMLTVDAPAAVRRGARAVHWMGRPVAGLTRRAPALGVVAVGMVLAGATLPGPAVQWAAGFVEDDLDTPDAGLRPLAQRSVIVAADGSPIAVLHGDVDRRIVPLEAIPLRVIAAVLSAEDTRFWRHEGYDVNGMARAAFADVRAGDVVQGGSTITQQLAKQNYVGDEQTVWRKGKEVLYAVALENRIGKKRVLERYLNEVYFGNGAYGIAAAAEHYFGVPPDQLTLAQAATLAGSIRSPSTLNPRQNPKAAERRRDAVLRAGMKAKLIGREAGEAAMEEPLVVAPPPPPPPTTPLVETIKQAFLANEVFGENRDARVEQLFRGGVRIETTIDPRLQAAAERVVRDRFPDPNGPTAAIASVDPRSGEIRALFGGTDQRFDLAAQGRRQPGSSFKAIAAIAAIESGVPLEQLFEGKGPIEIDYGGPEKWVVDNYEDGDHPPLNVHEALVKSVNTAYAQLAVQVGTERLVDVVGRLGIDVERALGPPTARGPAVALGGIARGVTPLEMAAAYGTLANGGEYRSPFLVKRVLDADGREIYRHEDEPRRGVSPEVAGHARAMLQDVVRRGTGTGAQLPGWDPFGKTGTTQDHADAWFVGAVPMLSTAVWSGHATGRVSVPGMTGGAVPAPLWRAFMSEALAGVTPEAFPAAPVPPPPLLPAVPPPPAAAPTPGPGASPSGDTVSSPTGRGKKRR